MDLHRRDSSSEDIHRQDRKRSFAQFSESSTSRYLDFDYNSTILAAHQGRPRGSGAAEDTQEVVEEPRQSFRNMSVATQRPQRSMSATFIDLTDDGDVEELAPPRPPQLARSDTVNLEEVIDLTAESSDNDADLEIVSTRVLTNVTPPIHPPRRAPAHARRRPSARRPAAQDGSGMMDRGLAPLLQHLGGMFRTPFVPGAWALPPLNRRPPVMPDHLNYAQAGWPVPEAPQTPRRKEYVPPPAAKEGFTRSPTEQDVIVCPSCEQELVAKEIEPAAEKKPGSKAPSKKDREEHPFWVVRLCGHVYCNDCYQARKLKTVPNVHFRGDSKHPRCAVDDCLSEVSSKDKWVGIFL